MASLAGEGSVDWNPAEVLVGDGCPVAGVLAGVWKQREQPLMKAHFQDGEAEPRGSGPQHPWGSLLPTALSHLGLPLGLVPPGHSLSLAPHHAL